MGFDWQEDLLIQLHRLYKQRLLLNISTFHYKQRRASRPLRKRLPAMSIILLKTFRCQSENPVGPFAMFFTISLFLSLFFPHFLPHFLISFQSFSSLLLLERMRACLANHVGKWEREKMKLPNAGLNLRIIKIIFLFSFIFIWVMQHESRFSGASMKTSHTK